MYPTGCTQYDHDQAFDRGYDDTFWRIAARQYAERTFKERDEEFTEWALSEESSIASLLKIAALNVGSEEDLAEAGLEAEKLLSAWVDFVIDNDAYEAEIRKEYEEITA